MDKRERKARLKEIITMIDESLVSIEDTKKFMKETEKKIDDLSWYFEMHCITPNSFDTEKMIQEILVDYFDNDNEIIEIRSDIQSLREEVYEHIDEMKDGANKEEWESFYSELEYIEDIIDIEEQEISSVEGFIENMKQLKIQLQNLV